MGPRCDTSAGTPGVFIRAIARPVYLGAPQLAYVSIARYSSSRRAEQALEVIRKREMPVLGRFDIPAARSSNGLKLRERGQGTLKPAFDGSWVGLLQRLRLRYVTADGTTSPERASATVYLLRNRDLVSVGLDRWPKSPGPTAYAAGRRWSPRR